MASEETSSGSGQSGGSSGSGSSGGGSSGGSSGSGQTNTSTANAQKTSVDEFSKVLLEILKQEVSPEATEARNMILRRIATESPVMPSRIPAPSNITEIGGYINLLERMGHGAMAKGMLSSILGQPAPISDAIAAPRAPMEFFSTHDSDRPKCSGVASLPLSFSMRGVFVRPFLSVLESLHAMGAYLPIMAPPILLPDIGQYIDRSEAMAIIGRRIEVAPQSAMVDPETDPIVVTRSGLFARGGETEIEVSALTRSSEGEKTISANLIGIEPLLARAGWYPARVSDPQDLLGLTNITGLVPGRSAYGDELSRLYTASQIASSGIRDLASWIWDGMEFIES